ncbi:secondary carrier transporter [Lithospermum erythrorhizon]|uniref:Secondary carrier transporter n=1 Tax=Lithospermum erythrorhizon TaxID=34254 RepID=A0AAV3RKC6_LITER
MSTHADIGVMSGAMLFIKADLKLSDTQCGVLAGILNIYSLIGAAAAGKTSDKIGRRYTIVFAASIFFVGSLLMGFANGYAFLMFGRFVAGIAVGYAMMIGPVYTAEISPASYRGFLTSFTEVFINIGILLGYVSNVAFSNLATTLNWRLMVGAGAIPSVILGVGVLAMPESPRWLVMKGRLGEAKRVLGKVSESQEEAEFRLAEIKEAAGISADVNDEICVVPEKSQPKGVWSQLLLRPTPAVRHILIVVLGLHFFQQASGIDALVLFSPKVFKKAGIQTTHQQLLATVAMGVTKTVFILVATFFLDKVGRRPLVLSSIGGMAMCLLGLAIGLTVVDHNPDHRIQWAVAVSVFSVLAYVAVFSMGMGPMVYVYCSEVFPTKLRAQGCSMGIAVNRVMSGVVSMSFLPLAKAVTTEGSFFIYAGIAGAGFAFFFLLLPETKCRTLEDMEKLFGSFINWRTTLKELKQNESAGNRQDGKGPIDA